jgi:PAS domain S-box-containing protein
MVDDTLINLSVDLALFAAPDGEIVFSKTLDPTSYEEIPLPEELNKYLVPDSPLLDLPETESHWAGIIRTSEGPLLIASENILTSRLEGPRQGVMLYGRFLNETKIAALSEELQLSLTLYQADNPLPDVQIARGALTAEPPIYIQTLSSDRIAATPPSKISRAIRHPHPGRCAPIHPPSGTGQRVVLRVIIDRCRASCSVWQLILIERTVLSRVALLGASVNHIRQSGNIADRVSATGKDELSRLAGTINGMLEALGQSEKELRERDGRIQAILNNAPIILWSMDSAGKFTFLEGTELKSLEIDNSQAIGHTVSEIGLDIPDLVEGIRRTLAGEVVVSTITSDDLTFDTHYIPLRDPNGAVTGIIGVATNITQRKKAEEALQQTHDNLEQKNQQLERVLELFRSTLDQMTDTVQRGASHEELTEYLTFVQSQFTRLE